LINYEFPGESRHIAYSGWRKAVSREIGLQTPRGLEPKLFGYSIVSRQQKWHSMKDLVNLIFYLYRPELLNKELSETRPTVHPIRSIPRVSKEQYIFIESELINS